MKVPTDLRYTTEHEWIRKDNGIGTAGITDYAQDSLGDIVYIELPEVGKKVKKGEAFGVIESVKAVSDLFSPVSGNIIEVNEQLKDNLEWINKDPYGEGWMIKIEILDPNELNELLSSQEYENYTKDEE
jgi:glycine cleavage system H protein